MATMCLLAASGAMALPDFNITAVDSLDPARSGETVTYTFTVGNTGTTTTAFLSVLDFTFPNGVPANATDAADAILNSIQIDPTIWDDASSGLVFSGDLNYCEGWTFQFQGLPIDPGDAGDIVFAFPAPEAVTETVLHFASSGLDLSPNYGRGGCADAITDCTGIPCLGPRIKDVPFFTAPLELVDDGTGATASLGCQPLVGFTPGNVAMIDRGTCFFETKIANALTAGASAVVIADNEASQYAPDGVINMACTDFCSSTLITIPAISVSYNNALALHAELGNGITVSMGAKAADPSVMSVGGYIWEFDTTTSTQVFSDPNQDDNLYFEDTLVLVPLLFADGFEGGDLTSWSSISP